MRRTRGVRTLKLVAGHGCAPFGAPVPFAVVSRDIGGTP